MSWNRVMDDFNYDMDLELGQLQQIQHLLFGLVQHVQSVGFSGVLVGRITLQVVIIVSFFNYIHNEKHRTVHQDGTQAPLKSKDRFGRKVHTNQEHLGFDIWIDQLEKVSSCDGLDNSGLRFVGVDVSFLYSFVQSERKLGVQLVFHFRGIRHQEILVISLRVFGFEIFSRRWR